MTATNRPGWMPPEAPKPVRAAMNPREYETKLSITAAAPANADRAAEQKSASARAAQDAVWAFRREIGELSHIIGWYGACFSRIRLTIGYEDPRTGEVGPAFDDEGKPVAPGAEQALEAVMALRSRVGGQSQLMRTAGECIAAVGECHLVGEDDDLGKRSWSMYSTVEFKFTERRNGVDFYEHRRSPGAAKRTVTSESAFVARIWQPDPEYSSLPWAAPMGMLDIFEELALLTREVAGQVKSRLAVAGLLFLADDVDLPEDENAPDDAPAKEPLTEMLIKVGSTAIRDKSSAAGVFPIVLRVPADRVAQGEGWDVYEPHREWDDAAAAKRDECIKRFAQGADAPPEKILGHMSTTFANAENITQATYTEYLEAKAQLLTDRLTEAYLRVVLPGTPFVIIPDAADLVVDPDRSADYITAYNASPPVVNAAAVRRAIGASEDDAPDDEELALRLEWEQSKRNATAPSLPDEAAQQSQLVSPLEPGVTEAAVAASADPDLYAALIEVEVRRALQRAGARIRSKVSGKAGLASLIKDVPDPHVAATLGQRQVEQVVTEAELFAREFDALASWVTEQADRRTAENIKALARAEAERRLYCPA